MMVHISNKAQILQFAKLAVKHNIPKVIFVSSTYACSRKHPINSMLQLEDEAAELLDKNGIEFIMLRPTSIFGTRPDGIKDRNMHIFGRYVIKLPLFPIFAKGKATVQPVWGRDVGQALFLCMRHFDELKGQRLIVSGDKERSFKEQILLLGKTMGKRVHFLYLPAWMGKGLFYGLYYLSFRHYDKREPIDRLLEDKAFDTSASLIELGYRPVPLEIALQKDKIDFDD